MGSVLDHATSNEVFHCGQVKAGMCEQERDIDHLLVEPQCQNGVFGGRSDGFYLAGGAEI